MPINGKIITLKMCGIFPKLIKIYYLLKKTVNNGFVFRASRKQCVFLKEGLVKPRGKMTLRGLYTLQMRVRLLKRAAKFYIAPERENMQRVHERISHQRKVTTNKEICDGCISRNQHRRICKCISNQRRQK